jgi:tRNA threonylcarbamoyladenosine biosynthesis protein TsaB
MLHILALCSSGNIASVSLLTDGTAVDEIVCETGKTHSETLMPAVERILGKRGMTVRDIDAFAVDIGPGSFTGVRIGVCLVNALAAALNKPVIAVDSLTAHYRDLADPEGEVAVLLDARGQRGYAARFSDKGQIEPPCAIDVADYLASVPPKTTFTGDGAFAYKEMIEQAVPDARFKKSSLYASRIAFAAWDKFQKGEVMSSALPLYLRISQAERMYEIRHGK